MLRSSLIQITLIKQIFLLSLILAWLTLALVGRFDLPRITTPQVMRRPQGQPLHYMAALDLSLARGPKAVDWNRVVWPSGNAYGPHASEATS